MVTRTRRWVIPLAIFTVILTDCASSLGTSSSPIMYFSSISDKRAWSVAMSPDGRLVVAGLNDDIICIWAADTGHLVERLQGHTGLSNYVVFTPDGKSLVSGSSTLTHWDISNVLRGGKAIPKKMKHTRRGGKYRERVWSVAVSQDGEWIVSVLLDGWVQLWDARTRELQLMLRGHKHGGTC
jgi:WD40 repeat protein